MKTLSLTLLSSLILVTSAVQAKTMTCELGVLRASSGGLMPANENIQFKDSVVIQDGHLNIDKCTQTQITDMKLSLCALEYKQTIGIYNVELLIEDVQSDLKSQDTFDFTSAATLFATARNGSDLVDLKTESALTPQFIKKMNTAKIKFPDYKGGDSLMIDDAVKKAYKKGVLRESDIVTVDVRSCKLD